MILSQSTTLHGVVTSLSPMNKEVYPIKQRIFALLGLARQLDANFFSIRIHLEVKLNSVTAVKKAVTFPLAIQLTQLATIKDMTEYSTVTVESFTH